MFASPAATRSDPAEASALGASADRLRLLVAQGQLGGGQPLIEVDLAGRLGVARSTVREALRRLESEGLLIARRRGLQVRRLGRGDVADLYELRELLEGLAARRAAARVAEEPKSWRPRVAAEKKFWSGVTSASSVAAFSVQNRRFHELVVEMAGNTHLPRMLDQTLLTLFAAQFRPWIDSSSMSAAAAGHLRIVEALERGAGAEADRAMRRHVRESARAVLALPDSAFD